MRTAFLAAALAAVAAISSTDGVAQQAYPSKPVKIIAPVQPGGGVDLVARTVAEQLSKSIGHPFVVENLAAAAASSARAPSRAPRQTATR